MKLRVNGNYSVAPEDAARVEVLDEIERLLKG